MDKSLLKLNCAHYILWLPLKSLYATCYTPTNNSTRKDADTLYEFLKSQKRGLLGSKDTKWNFTKFLVDREGKVIERFAPSASPCSFEKKIKAARAQERKL